MKILLAHNFYRSASPSGENQVYEAERELLLQRGHEVLEYTRHSDDLDTEGYWGIVKGALSTPWNFKSASCISKIVDDFQPDVVHVHNTFPLLSPAIFHSIGRRFARVLTLHNYRLFCSAAIPMRAGVICTECLDKHHSLPALRHGCYRKSRLATIPLAFNVMLHRSLGTWSNEVEAFIALTEFQRARMISASLPTESVYVKPNFFPGTPQMVSWANREPKVVFAGRLTEEKGVETLLRAWILWGPSAPELRVIGDGVLRSQLERMAAKAPEVRITFLGQLPAIETKIEIAKSRLLVLPSECLETFGMVIVEAFASGTPAAVSNIGSLSATVRHGVNGVVFPPRQPEFLLEVLRKTWQLPGELERLGVGARKSYEGLYTDEANYRSLMHIYECAIEASKRKGISRRS